MSPTSRSRTAIGTRLCKVRSWSPERSDHHGGLETFGADLTSAQVEHLHERVGELLEDITFRFPGQEIPAGVIEQSRLALAAFGDLAMLRGRRVEGRDDGRDDEQRTQRHHILDLLNPKRVHGLREEEVEPEEGEEGCTHSGEEASCGCGRDDRKHVDEGSDGRVQVTRHQQHHGRDQSREGDR